MRKVILLFLALCLTGCSSTRWYRENTSDQQYYQDNYACTQEAQQYSASAYVNPYGGAAQGGAGTNWTLYKQCMYARGYRESASQPVAQQESTRPLPELATCAATAVSSGAPTLEVAEAACQCLFESVPSPTAVTQTEFLAAVRTCKAEEQSNSASFTEKYRSRIRR